MRLRLFLVLVTILVLVGPGLAQQVAPALLSVVDVYWQQRSSDLVVGGTLVNQASRVVWDVRLGFAGYDKSGYPVANGGVWFRSIGPEEELPFEAHAGTLGTVTRVEVFIRSVEEDPPAHGAAPLRIRLGGTDQRALRTSTRPTS